MSMIRTGILAMALVLASPVMAHEGAVKGPHGGQMVDVGGRHWELVAKDSDLTLFISDASEKPVPTNGAKATASVLVDGKQSTVILAPVDPNLLKGKGAFVAAKGMKVVVSFESGDGKAETLRFTPAD